jgi:3-oxoacyl-[acyl-carrier-protein] synthase-3
VTGISITGWGTAVPAATLTNADLAARLEVTEDWIFGRTGIRARRVAGEGESTATLAATAGRRALEEAGRSGSDVAHLIVATSTPEQPCPATSAFVHHELGVAGSAHDLNAQCAGPVYGLVSAAGLMALDPGPILLVGVDTQTRTVDPADRDLMVLTGDGAGAVVLEPAADSWLTAWDLGCDGSAARSIEIPAGGSRRPASAATVRDGLHYARMKGAEVYVNAVRRSVQSVRRTLEAAKVGPEQVDHVVPHQANIRIVHSMLEHSGLPADGLVTNLEQFGNTGSASILMALAQALDDGIVETGHLVLLVGFGAGITWGSTLLTWGGTR